MNWNIIKTNWFSLALLLLYCLTFGNGNTADKMPALSKETTFGLAAATHEPHGLPLEVNQSKATAFLKRFAPVAVSERKKFGVPASILLASSFLNSNAGCSQAALKANNFFALPCTSDWEGETATIGTGCVRTYESPWASWRDYSIYLSSCEWFGVTHKASGKDWKKWTKSLKGKNISNIANFEDKLGEVIVYYRLYELDQL
jgi:flagellum-specific peptidoglycan hydrolase FlgJ